MVYRRYVKRDGNVFGPYYYESYRDKNGRVKTRFISKPTKKDRIIKKLGFHKIKGIGKTIRIFLIISLIILAPFLLFILLAYINNIAKQFTGNIVSEETMELFEMIINSPTATIYSTNLITFNVTLNKDGYCKYSLDSGATNITMNTMDNRNFYYFSTLNDVSYIVNFYCNDNYGNESIAHISFSIDTNVESSNSRENIYKNCTSVLNCTEWSECINNTQTKKCDEYCAESKKIEGFFYWTRKCNYQVSQINKTIIENKKISEPALGCSNWSECQAAYNLDDLINENIFFNGEKTRECRLEGGKILKEIETCETKMPIETSKLRKCSKDYLVISDLAGKTISLLEPISSKELNINFLINGNFYCDYCYDKIKDYDEDKVDCSYSENGSCPLC